MAEVGTVTVKVVPDMSEFADKINSAWFAAVLYQYTAWLGNKGLLTDGAHSRGVLVDGFIAERDAAKAGEL